MNSPLSFVPDGQSAPSSFVPDQQSKPSSFVPDSSPVLNQNATGMDMRANFSPMAFQNRTAPGQIPLQPSFVPNPRTYTDGMAMKSPMDVQSPGIGTSMGEVANAPLMALGKVAAMLLNEAAGKNLPDNPNQMTAFELTRDHATPDHMRNFLQKAIFGPSNLSVLGKDPNAKMFQQGQSLLPEQRNIVGADSDARKMAEGLTTPESLASVPLSYTKLGPAITAMFGASTAANLPNMSNGDIMANALMMGLPMLAHKGYGAPEIQPNRPDMQHMNGPEVQGILPANPISRSIPLVKEQPALPTSNEIKQPVDTTVSTVPVGGDINKNSGEIEPSVSRGTLSPADLGKEMGLTVKQWPEETPVIGGSYSLTDPKTGYTIENLRDGVTKEEVQSRLDAKQKEVKELFGNQGQNNESGSLGLHVLDPEVWKDLGFRAKVGAEQFVNRLRNKLGGDSAGWKMIDTPEFQEFMKGGPKTTQEVQDFVNSNGPKVEIRKFGQGSITTPEQKRFAELEHYFDSLPASQRGVANHYLTHNDQESLNNLGRLNPEAQRFASEYNSLNKIELHKGVEQSHWQSIAPKSEQDMPGYTELAVVKPVMKTRRYPDMKSDTQMVEHPQFPSSHNFPPNTLGFARGYMEHTTDGKKVFHVIEVQSDWAQRQREGKQEFMEKGLAAGNKSKEELEQMYKDKPTYAHDELLGHYERLTLKAAIDHAREQGADSIAISDAETAMMTEGHDRAARETDNYTKGESIPQEQGMRLHYDRTLPKIAEELTGEKGTKESFGEHKMALDDSTHNQNRRLGYTTEPSTFRKDLIFRNESGEPKTDITARVYPIKKAASDFSIISKDKPRIGNQDQTSESGAINLDAIREGLGEAGDTIKEFFSDQGIRRKTMKMSGVSVPKTTSQNESVGNQLAMFAQSEGVAEAVARSKASEVLGKHWNDSEFANKLGAVGVEDQLRTLKAQLLAKGKTAEAQSVNTLVGQPYSPIKSEAQYQQLKSAPEIVAALDRHKQLVQSLAEDKQKSLGGALRAPGQDTGAFFNLIAKGVDDGTIPSARKGNPLATLKGGTRFGKEFKGTAAEYETDYRKMAERMVKGNWTEVEKQKLFDVVDSTGFGHLQKAGEDLPTFDKPMSPIPVQRRMAVIVKPGEKPVMKSQNETLWVPTSSAEEFRQAFQTDSPLKTSLQKGLGLLTKVQTGLGADAAFHVGNMAAAVVTSPEKATAVKLMVENLAKTFETNPTVQKRLADMAEEAGIVRQGEDEVSSWKKLIPGKNMISWVDQAGRLTLDQLYKDAVKRGESPNSPIWRRAAVQGALGEYNKRLMPKVQQIMKESGFSPFLTAGKTFNRLSVRQLMLSPGRKAVDAKGGAKMRLRQALYTTGLVVGLPMMMNQLMTGNPFPKGVQPGQFVVKKNDDGSYVVEDVAQLLMMRRGLRNTGIQAVAQGIEDKQSIGQIAKQAGKDIGRGLVRPIAGPALSALDTLTGGGELVDKPNQPLGTRAKEAGKQLNPTANILLNDDATKTGSEKMIGGFGRTIGLKVTPSNVSRVNQLAHQWMERNGVSTSNEPAGPYRDLTAALRKNDASAARTAVGGLIASGKTDAEIKKYYKDIPDRTFTDSSEHEGQFLSELSSDDQKVYQSVKDSNKLVRTRFYQMFLPNSPMPLDKLPKMQKMEKIPSRFPIQR